MITAAEATLGIRFHPSLREYFARFGWIEMGHREFFGLGVGVPRFLEITSLTTSERTEAGAPLPTRLLPLLNDGGGSLYCVVCDESAADDGTVVLWDHEQGVHQEPAAVASDLAAWLDLLLDET